MRLTEDQLTTARTLSPTGRRALAQLYRNRGLGWLTHRSAVHQSAREALMARNLIAWSTSHHDTLRLTVDGVAVAAYLDGEARRMEMVP